MNIPTENQTVFIVTEKQPHDDYFNTFKPVKLIETVSAIALTDFEDRVIFEPGGSRCLVRRLKPGEELLFDLPSRFLKGGYVVTSRINDVTVLRTIIFDSKARRYYEAIVETEMFAYFDKVKAEIADAIARL